MASLSLLSLESNKVVLSSVRVVLCQFIGVLLGVALLRLLDIDAELGQVTIIAFVLYVVDNGDAIAVVILFAAAV
jgi:hypothetical protein